MEQRQKIALGMGCGMIWAALLLWIGARLDLPIFALVPTVMTAFLAPGLVLIALVGTLAARRFTDADVIDGAAFPPGSPGEIERRVLRNSVEQVALALAVWPGAAVLLGENGPGVVAALGAGLALARIAFWAGYRISPPLRAFGFAASFYPTVLVAGWALIELVV